MGILKSLFSKSEKQEITPVDFSAVVADMHSHLIPGIDDGAQDIEQSIHLIKELHALGFTKLITTPHIFWDIHKNTPESILPGLALLRAELKQRNIPVEIFAAAEYYLDENFESLIEKKQLMTFGNNYVLFEISFASEPANLGRAIFNLHLQGYRPIIAHPERYEFWHTDFSKYEALADKDVLLQLNTNCLTGHYGKGVQRISEKLIDAGLISFIGSDCHHPGHIEMLQNVRTNPHLKKLMESGKLLNPTLA